MQYSIHLKSVPARAWSLLVLLFLLIGGNTFAATVTTDREDYQPGMTVHITGTGWTPGETVNLHLDQSCGCLHPDWTTVAHADGTITNSDFIIQDFHLGVTFLLTATGQTSGLTAQTTFTDARIITNATLNGASSVSVQPGTVITAAVTVVTTGVGSAARWRSTGWRIATTPPGSTTCTNHADFDTAGTNTQAILMTAPTTPGVYNAYFIAYDNDACSSGASVTFVMSNAVIVGPSCVISGPATACPGTTNTFRVTSDVGTNFVWSLTNNNSGSFIVGATNTNVVQIVAGASGSYTVHVLVRSNQLSTTCTQLVTILSNTVVAGSTTNQRPFAFEYTAESSQIITFVNRLGTSQTITVNIFEPDGTPWSGGTKTVALNGFQTKTIIPKDDWGLLKKTTGASGHGTPSEDTAYGIIASAPGLFSVITYSDETQHGGSGRSAIWVQRAMTEAAWGMWNYDGSDDKKDYFFLFNPNLTAASVAVVLRRTNGAVINSVMLTVGARSTVKIYPAIDLGSNPGANNNIGVFLHSSLPIHISVYTQLGRDYDASANPPWKTHDVVSGVFVPFSTDCLSDTYTSSSAFTDAQSSGQQQTAARVTNPNGFAVQVIEDWFPFDQSPIKYSTTNNIPAFGTAELPLAPNPFKDESASAPRTHFRTLTATGPSGPALIHAHVSYFEQIDLPSVPKTEWFWGEKSSSQTDTVFLVNPTGSNITIQLQRWKNGNTTPIAGSSNIVLLARASIMAQLPSEGANPPNYNISPISGDSTENQTFRFFSTTPFVLHVQHPFHGDVFPADMDPVAPLLICASNRIVQCGAPWDFTPPTASDHCDCAVTIRVVSTVTNQGCGGTFTATRTWEATDLTGNPALCSQTITVSGTLVLTCPSNLTVQCQSDVPPCPTNLTQFLAQGGMISGACDTNLTYSCSDGPLVGGVCGGTITRRHTVTDSCTNSTSCVQIITVNDTIPPVSCATAPANMISWWPGDGNFNDIQDGNHGSTLFGAVPFTAGKVGQAFQFNGVGIVSAGTPSNLQLTGTQVTIDGWINPSLNNESVYFGRSVSGQNDYTLYLLFGQLTASIRTTASGETFLPSGFVPPTNTWTHVALTYDGAMMRIYANGALVASVAKSGNIANGSAPFFIGGRTDTLRFRGLIDEVEVFNRALSATEIQAIYNAGSFGKCRPVVVAADSSRCDAVVNYATLPVSDNCDTNPTITCTPPSGSAFALGTNTVTCVASDDCNSVTNTFTVTVRDTQAPMITCPSNRVVECGTEWDFGTPTATDNCDTNVAISIVGTTTNLMCGKTLTATRTWRATDDSGNTNHCSQTVTVVDTTPPTITCATSKTAECGDSWNFDQPTATDTCGDVTVANIGTTTNALCGNTFSATRTWSATDQCGNSNTCSQTVTVVDTKPPETCVTAPANMVGWWPGEGNANDIQDGNHGMAQGGVTFPAGIVGQAFSFNGSNQWVETTLDVQPSAMPSTTWDAWVFPTRVPHGARQAILSADDGGFDRGVLIEAGIPFFAVFTGFAAIPTAPVDLNQWQHIAVVYEPGGPGTVKFYKNGVLFGPLPAIGQASTNRFTIGANPLGGFIEHFQGLIDEVQVFDRALSASEIAAIHSAGSFGKCPPVMVATQPGQCDAVVNYTPPPIADNCNTGSVIICSPPPGSTFPQGTATVTCIASDGCNSVTNSFVVIVKDTEPPSITCGTNRTVECGTDWDFDSPAATDNCTNVTVGIVSTETNALCGATFSATRTWEATDGSGNTSGCSQTITVVDTTPPTITCETNRTDECATGAAPLFGEPVVSDACDTNVTITFVDSELPANCPAVRVFRRTWTATDDCTNRASCSQTITFVDTAPPIITCQPDQTNEWVTGASPAFGEPTVSDACDTNVTVTFVDSELPANCPAVRIFRRTWTATDDCTNRASCSQTITFVDTTPPTLMGVPNNANHECLDEVPPPANVTATDTCDTNVPVTFSATTNGFCPTVIERTWTATDDCSNTVSATQTIFVQSEPPEIVSGPTNQVVCPGARVTFCVETTSRCGVLYQWCKGPMPIPGATNACLTLSNVATADAGQYCVKITGEFCFRQDVFQEEGDPEPEPPVLIVCARLEVSPQITAEGPFDTTRCPGETVAFCTKVSGGGGGGSVDAFSTDFESGTPAGTTTSGVAYVGGDGVLHLTEAVHFGSFGGFDIADPFGGANVTALSVRWRSLIGGGFNGGADGYSFNWATDLPAATGEEGGGTGLTVTVDTFDNGGGEAPGVEIKWQGSRVAFAAVSKDDPGNGVFLRKNQFVDAEVTVTPAGLATFTYDGTTVSAFLSGFTGFTGGNFQFGARTGGASDNQWIDEVRIGTPADNCPVTFAWFKDGQIIPGQTNSCLELTNVTPAHSGEYCVRAIGCCNTVTNCARLTVPSPSTAVCPKNKKVDCDDEWRFDDPRGEGVRIVSTETNALCGSSYIATRVWIVGSDQCGSLLCTQKVTVEASLDIDCADDKIVECGEPWDFDEPDVESCDDDYDVDILYTILTTLADGSVRHTRKWRVRDECGNEETCKQIVTVRSALPPSIVCAPDKTVACGSAWVFDAPSANGLLVMVVGTVTNGACGETYTATRTWEVTGTCGGVAQCSQTVSIVDTLAPVLLNCPTNLVIECGPVPPPARVTAIDFAGTGAAQQILLNPINIVGGSGSFENTIWNDPASAFNAFRIVDEQTGPISEPRPGNFWLGRDSSATEYIVIDLGRPYFIDRIDLFNTHNHVFNDRRTRDFQIQGGASVTDAGASGLNLSGSADLILSNRLSFHSLTNDPIEPDTFTVANGLAPYAAYRYLRFETLNGYGNDNVGLNEIRIYGRIVCDPDVPVVFTETRLDGACLQSYTLTRTWSAVDDCGNPATCTQTITVDDTTPPLITCPPDQMLMSLTELPACPKTLTVFVAGGGSAADECSTTLHYVCEDGPFMPSGCGGIIVRRHAVVDACGNSNSCVQVMRIEGVASPVVPALADQTVCEGGAAIFAAMPAGSGPFRFVWRHNGTLLPGETNSFLGIAAASTLTVGQYSVEVIGPCGSTTNSASLILAAPTAATPLTDLARTAGESATFSTVASGEGPFTYVWRHNGTILADQFDSSLTLPSVTPADAGTYTVEVSGRCNVVILSAALTVLAPEPFAEHLVSHWKLDETNSVVARDSVGSNHGSLIEGPLCTAGVLGSALRLDGLDDCVEVLHDPSLNLSNRFSISFWFRPAATLDGTSGRRELLNKSLSYCLVLNAATNDGKLAFAFNNGSPAVKSTTTSWPSTRWSHVVGVHDGASLRLYVNGEFEAAAPAGALPRVIGYPLLFGGDPEQGGFYAGLLDDVRIYSTNLPPAQVTALFNSGMSGAFAPTGLALTVEREAGRATLRWASVSGVRYRVEYKTELSVPEWTALPGEVIATGPSATKEDALSAHQRRFYRVVALP